MVAKGEPVDLTAPGGPAEGGGGEVARLVARVATRLFAERGYDATSVREIVEAAGVTKPTLYYHFGSKEGLGHAVLTRPLNQLLATHRAALAEQGDPVATLERMLEADFAFCREDPDRVRFVYAVFFGPLGSGLSTELAAFGEQVDALWLTAVERAAQAGGIDPERVAACTTAMRAMVVIHTIDFLYGRGELGVDLPARIVSDLLRGFGAAPGKTGSCGRS